MSALFTSKIFQLKQITNLTRKPRATLRTVKWHKSNSNRNQIETHDLDIDDNCGDNDDNDANNLYRYVRLYTYIICHVCMYVWMKEHTQIFWGEKGLWAIVDGTTCRRSVSQKNKKNKKPRQKKSENEKSEKKLPWIS